MRNIAAYNRPARPKTGRTAHKQYLPHILLLPHKSSLSFQASIPEVFFQSNNAFFNIEIREAFGPVIPGN
jgi:hypothetical protein